LYRPPVKSSTALLWFGPIILLLIGLTVLIVTLKKRKQLLDESLTDEQQSQMKHLLDDGEK